MPAAQQELGRRLLSHYRNYCHQFNIRPDVLWAQMLLETNGLRFTGQVKIDQHNYCGLKNAAGTGYATFPTEELGALAHVAHMAAYVFPDHVNSLCTKNYDPRHPDFHWYSIKVVGDLGGKDEQGRTKWAERPDYATSIVRVWEKGI